MLDLLGIRKALEDIALQLKRLADLSERRAKFVALGQDPTGRDASYVAYTNDAEQLKREVERAAYQLRTGKTLPEWEEVPGATDESGDEWGV